MDKIPSDDEDFLTRNLTQLITEDPTFDFLTEQESTSADKIGSTECSDITASDSQEATGYSHGARASSHCVSGNDSHAESPGCSRDVMQYDHGRTGGIQSTSEHPSGVTPYAHDEAQCSNDPAENISDYGLHEFNLAGTEFKHGSTERDHGVTKTSGYIGDESTYSKDTDDMSAQGLTTRHRTVTHGAPSTHDDAYDHVDISGDTHTLITGTQQEDHACPIHSSPHQYKESSKKDKGMDKDENFICGKRDKRQEQRHCEICTKMFRSDSDLKQRSGVCAEQKALASTTCGKTLKSRNSDHHTLIHRAQKPHECKYCHKFFKTGSTLNTHIRIHTGEKPYKCQYCSRFFRCKSDLNRHIKTHTGEKPYKCNFCPKSFRQTGQLTEHIRTHTGEKPYKCNFCPKSFRKTGQLTEHIRTHTGEKPYKCNFCPKSFRQHSHLIHHTQIHTGEKRYKCQYCRKFFRRISNLNIHTRTHTGEKPYECNFCPKSFRQTGHLIRHTLIHTGEKPYECKHCSKSFKEKSLVDAHTLTHTVEQQSSLQTHVFFNNSDSNP